MLEFANKKFVKINSPYCTEINQLCWALQHGILVAHVNQKLIKLRDERIEAMCCSIPRCTNYG
jgi:hypothetical protein